MKVIKQDVPVVGPGGNQLSGRGRRVLVGHSISDVDDDRRVGLLMRVYPRSQNTTPALRLQAWESSPQRPHRTTPEPSP